MIQSPLSRRVLVNSMPKSGTHLLAQAVGSFGYEDYFSVGAGSPVAKRTPLFLHYSEARDLLAGYPQSDRLPDVPTISVGVMASCPVPVSLFRDWLAAMPTGHYLLGHLPWNPDIPDILSALAYHHVFIIRDPRAVLVSLLNFILDPGKFPRRHFLEADLKSMSPAGRLDFMLTGGYAPGAGLDIPAFPAMYQAMLKWQQAPGCLTLRYEDLVGTAGGGTREAQRDSIYRLAVHLGHETTNLSPDIMEKLYNPASRTFRTAKIEGWRNQLEPALLRRLQTALADLCQQQGYEVNDV